MVIKNFESRSMIYDLRINTENSVTSIRKSKINL